jgi:hypothetical protein
MSRRESGNNSYREVRYEEKQKTTTVNESGIPIASKAETNVREQ